jgi:predicted TIM-barrel fold metal-dependent hydrolase
MPPRPRLPKRIIDVHTHPILFEANETKEEVGRIIDYSRRFGYERMVILGDVLRFGKEPTAKQVRVINDWTIRNLEWYPDFFIGFCFLNPVLGARAVRREVKRCVERGFRGIKLEICNNARDRVMGPVMEVAEEYDIPILQHTADMTVLKARKWHSDPNDTAWLGRKYPNNKIIMAHLTASGLRGTLEIQDVPNVYHDTSAYLPFAGRLEFALEKLGADRLLYGTDLVIRDIPSQLGRILGTDMSTSDRRKILYGNAARLLKLND